MTQYELLKEFAKYGHIVFKTEPIYNAFMLTLLSYYNHETGECWPSNESIENGCGIDKSNLHRYKARLREVGLIKTANRKMGDGLRHSDYFIQTDFIIQKIGDYKAALETE